MSPSPGLAPGLGAVTLRTLHRQIRPQRGRPDNGSGRASHHLAETGISLWPDHERILSEYKRASCLKPASDSLRRPNCAKKHASLPLLQCWPKSCTGSPRQKVGRQQQDRSCAWSSICQSTMRLPHPRSTVCTRWEKRKTLLLAIGHAAGNLFSEDGRRIFICARQSFGGGRSPWDPETDNHVPVDQSIRRTVSHATPEVGERLAGDRYEH